MANEFVARRGIIAQSGGAKITGSLLVSGAINATGYTITGDTITGAIAATNNVVSSSAQVKDFLPTDTVSSSIQFKTLTDPFTGSFTGSFTGDGSALTGIATTLSITGSDATTDTVDLKTSGLTFSGANGISTSVAGDTVTIKAPLGTVTSSAQVKELLPTDTVSSSVQVKAFLPDGSVSSSAQYPGWVTASSQVDITATTGYTTFSQSLATVDQGQDAQIASLMDKTGSYATTASNSFTGVQTITNTTNSTNYTDGALVVQGGVGIAKDVNISGSLNVTGLLTAVSQSIQYVTSSQINIGGNKIVLNTDAPAVQFGGISVIDSGSGGATGSLYWDSVNNHWIYQNSAEAPYNSAILIAGPKNAGNLGEEVGLITGRVPVTTGDDHIDTAPASSSIRIAFDTQTTHVEHGLYITGSVTSSVGFSGDGSQLTGIVTTLNITGSDASTDSIDLKTSGLTFSGGNGITTSVANDTVTISTPLGTVSSSGQVKNLLPTDTVSSSTQVTAFLPADTVSSSTQVKAFLPGGTVSSSAQYPGWVTASSQIQLASITGTTFANSTFSFPSDVQVTGSLIVKDATISNTLYSGSVVTGIVGPVTNQVVAFVSTATYDAAHFDYIIKDGSNYRTGTVMTVWDGSNVEFTDTSTNDIGNTSDVSFAVDINTGLARLKITTGTGTWVLKTSIRAL